MKEENKFAKSAIIATLEKLGTLYNPLYLYGNNGEEKEKIINTILIETTKNSTPIKTLTGEEMLKIIEHSTIEKECIDCDLLFLNGFEKVEKNTEAQRRLLYILNTRIKNEKQIIIYASKEPNELVIDNRLKNRLTWGLQSEIK